VPKFITAVALASMVALPLVACSSPAAPECVATPAGSNSSQIKVSGDFGEQPDVTLPNAFDATTTERSVVISGDGELVGDGEVASVKYAAYNATTGDTLELSPDSTWSDAQFIVDSEKSFPGIFKALNCSRVGDRIVAAVPPGELFGGVGVDMTAAGIGTTDTVVFVFDIEGVEPAPTDTSTPSDSPSPSESASPVPLPTPAAWTSNVPKVDLTGDTPVVTLPSSGTPTTLLLAVLTEGTGDVVTQASTVTVDYQGTSWDSGQVFGQSYGSGAPATFQINGLIEGFAAALVGEKAGSTVLVTIPPAQAYGEGTINDQDLVGQTLLFVIHIISVS
jgi:FKBP-type peptidyl-prolyl cis-trans isomerase 2